MYSAKNTSWPRRAVALESLVSWWRSTLALDAIAKLISLGIRERAEGGFIARKDAILLQVRQSAQYQQPKKK